MGNRPESDAPFVAPPGDENQLCINVPIDEDGRRVCVVRIYCPEPDQVGVQILPPETNLTE